MKKTFLLLPIINEDLIFMQISNYLTSEQEFDYNSRFEGKIFCFPFNLGNLHDFVFIG